MKKIISALLCILCLCALAGCNAKSDKVLHNARWDMTKQELIEAEGKENIINGATDTVLNWMHTKDLTVFGDRMVSVGYIFVEDQLKSITVQIFANDGESLADAMSATRAEMEKTYGTAHGDDATAHWHTDNGSIAFSKLEGTEKFFVANFSPALQEHEH